MGSGMFGPSDTVKLIFLSSYEVCSRPDHYIRGKLELRRNGSCVPVLFIGTIRNPPVELEGVSGINVVYLDGIEAEPIDTDLYQGQTQMLVTKKSLNDTVVCKSLIYGPGLIPVVYVKYYGKWYIHSLQFQLLENTPTTPLLDGSASIVNTIVGYQNLPYYPTISYYIFLLYMKGAKNNLFLPPMRGIRPGTLLSSGRWVWAQTVHVYSQSVVA